MFLIDFSRYFSQCGRFLAPGAFTFPTSSFHVPSETRSILFLTKYDKIISYDEQKHTQKQVFSKRLKIQ